MTTKTKRPAAKFENRVRFNWGYHQGALAVQQAWGPEQNYGFGPAVDGRSVEAIMRSHPDNVYARGFQQGLIDAQDGCYEGNSERSWAACLAAGHVTA